MPIVDGDIVLSGATPNATVTLFFSRSFLSAATRGDPFASPVARRSCAGVVGRDAAALGGNWRWRSIIECGMLARR